jgi:hypothetical protein
MEREIIIRLNGNRMTIDFNEKMEISEVVDIMASSIGIIVQEETNKLSLLNFAFDILESYIDNDLTYIQPERLN